ncbi:TPA: hypothetical protein DD449_05010 [Candidatus Berkelbacteria bacterium]|uniref:Uncharacterized protein n=1 Tax=Berkelbacteria bacterium GW2011_GWE1_39_12 TaxID=1618337 RepID=A0A0G4B5X5_9BACT|nr:MAG: hypothetical protein UT28_C0001G0621 [Berkelbacteria bacterium GW2011_GWE1_39_12]HBO61013.1 hypothetical protein [Candidatus Berkelbacteria bacterium]
MPIDNHELKTKIGKIEQRLNMVEKREQEDFIGIYSRLDNLEESLRKLENDIAAVHLNNQ